MDMGYLIALSMRMTSHPIMVLAALSILLSQNGTGLRARTP
jgi:hypothetical protein